MTARRPGLLGWALIALGAAAGLSAEPIMMPPFLVAEKTNHREPYWIHGADAQIEVLSACDEGETTFFLQQVRRRRQDLERIVPAEFLQRTTLPTTLIVFPSSEQQSMSDEVVRMMATPGRGQPNPRIRPLTDLRLDDADSTTIFVFLNDRDWRMFHDGSRAFESKIVFTPAYLRFLLQARVPVLPDWYVTGMTAFYQLVLSSKAEFLGSASDLMMWDRTATEPWTSPEEVRALSAHAEAPRTLVPLGELFAALEPRDKSAAYRTAWAAEAELFIRWAYSNQVKDGREKLKRFVIASAGGAPSEAAFEAAFGLNYADALEAVSDYLPTAVRDPLDFGLAAVPVVKPLELQEATASQIHRIKGDWSRRTLRVIRQNDPPVLPLFVQETGQLLQGAYDRGDRDPRLAADLALFRVETGDLAGAARLLAADPRVAAARPLGEVELALWSLDEALRQPQGEHGALSAAQVGDILRRLDRVRQWNPPLESCYLIAARVAEHAGRDPTAAERARLDEGARLFPRDTALVMKSAAWDLRAGDYAAAVELTALGMAQTDDPALLGKLAVIHDLGAKVAATTTALPGG